MKRSLFIALAMLVLALPGLVLLNACSSPISQPGLKAAIVDQLYPLYPNQGFIDQSTGILETSGFQVDTYRGDQINVDFYRRLPAMGYTVIIFRSHSGLQQGTVHSETGDHPTRRRTYLFTNQPYSENTLVFQQVSDRLAKVRVDSKHPWLFGITADFVRRSMEGRFDHTFIIMMGCSTLSIDDMADSFIEKGASIYTGWDASVGLDYVDHATLNLIDSLFSKQEPVETAVRATMLEKGTDPNWEAKLKYYPDLSGKKTLTEAIK